MERAKQSNAAPTANYAPAQKEQGVAASIDGRTILCVCLVWWGVWSFVRVVL